MHADEQPPPAADDGGAPPPGRGCSPATATAGSRGRSRHMTDLADLAEQGDWEDAQKPPPSDYALASSPFALLDTHGSLRLIIDLVPEDDALCLALSCRVMRDALGVRFPTCPRAGGRAGAELATRVTAEGVLDLNNGGRQNIGLRMLPGELGRLAYLPKPGLKRINLIGNTNLTTLPDALWSLVGLEALDLRGCRLASLPAGIGRLSRLKTLLLADGVDVHGRRPTNPATRRDEWDFLPETLWLLVELEELSLSYCGLVTLPEGIGRLVGLRQLRLGGNKHLALPEGLWSLKELIELNLSNCGLTSLSEGIGRMTRLTKLALYNNRGLSTLPNGLSTLTGLEDLSLDRCGLTVLPEGFSRLAGLRRLSLSGNQELTELPAGLWELAGLEELFLDGCGLRVMPEGIEGPAGLKLLDLSHNKGLSKLPVGLSRLHNLEQLAIGGCPGLAVLEALKEREGLTVLLAHLATYNGEPVLVTPGPPHQPAQW